MIQHRKYVFTVAKYAELRGEVAFDVENTVSHQKRGVFDDIRAENHENVANTAGR